MLASASGGTLVSNVSQAVLESLTHDDIEARRMLQCAQGTFQKWPEGFAGFSATIRCSDRSNALVGTVSVFAGGRVELDLAEAGALAAWVQRELAAISSARTPQFFKDGDGRFPITFEPDNRHPLGRGVRVHLGDVGWRTYRVDRKGRIRQQENAESTTRAAAMYDGFVRACPGRVLPTRIRILNWNVSTQTVIETADIEDAYERREHVWLPVRRRAVVVQGQQRREIGFELSNHVVV
jgi:hypothetical protein